MPRCFIALNLPTEVKAEFKKIQDDLRQKNSGVKITWVDPCLAHINLHFLGDLKENEVNDLKENLALSEGKFGPLTLSLTGAGAFPSLKMPRILFLGLRQANGDSLIRLYQEIGQILKTQKLSPEERPFIAHVTLGRIKDRNKKVKIIGEEMPNITFQVKSFELMESTLRPAGPEYKVLNSYQL